MDGTTYTTTYRYDALSRLLSESRTPGDYSLGYGYDLVGNRTSRDKDGTTVTYAYDDNDKLTGASGGGQSASFGYDNNGNMTSVTGDMLGAWSLTYDDANRPTSIIYPSGTDTFLYNSSGQRARANLNGTIYRYVYDGARVLEQTDDAGDLLTRYTTASASYYQPLLAFEFSDGTVRYPLSDLVGTSRRLVTPSGVATDAYSLDAFGRYLDGWGSTPNPYRYGADWGYITDTPGSGLLQLGQRYYWPEIGRFTQQDPLGDGTNWYAYMGNGPTVSVDPDGLTAATNAAFFAGWASGTLPSDIYYSNGSVEVAELQSSPGVNALRDQFYNAGTDIVGTGSYDSWTAFKQTVTDPASTAFQVGGWAGASVIDNGNGTITFQIDNTAGTKSFFYHVVPNRKGTTGPMHNVRQHFNWTEPARPGSWPGRPKGPNGRGGGSAGPGGKGLHGPGGRGGDDGC